MYCQKENRAYPYIHLWLFIPLNKIKSYNIFQFNTHNKTTASLWVNSLF